VSTDQETGHPDAEVVVPLRAVPAPAGEVQAAPATGTPVYADVTAPGERRPILPHWLRSKDAARHHTKRVSGAAAHTSAYHAVRSPVYLAHATFWAIPGVVKLTLMWLRWWLFPVPAEIYADAVADGHRAWHRTAKVHREMAATRAAISLLVILAAVVLFKAAAGTCRGTGGRCSAWPRCRCWPGTGGRPVCGSSGRRTCPPSTRR
jgi:S-DNA-T family DNA segregation ATPase FtsK/SpoIIIE